MENSKIDGGWKELELDLIGNIKERFLTQVYMEKCVDLARIRRECRALTPPPPQGTSVSSALQYTDFCLETQHPSGRSKGIEKKWKIEAIYKQFNLYGLPSIVLLQFNASFVEFLLFCLSSFVFLFLVCLLVLTK